MDKSVHSRWLSDRAYFSNGASECVLYMEIISCWRLGMAWLVFGKFWMVTSKVIKCDSTRKKITGVVAILKNKCWIPSVLMTLLKKMHGQTTQYYLNKLNYVVFLVFWICWGFSIQGNLIHLKKQHTLYTIPLLIIQGILKFSFHLGLILSLHNIRLSTQGSCVLFFCLESKHSLENRDFSSFFQCLLDSWL